MNAHAPLPATSGRQRGQAAWATLATRERRLLTAALAVLALALLWGVGLGPALQTLRSAEAQQRALDLQLQTMHALAAEAASLQALPRIKSSDSRKALEQSVRQRLGASAQIAVQGDRATVTLKNASPEALTQWLVQARNNARAIPLEVRLTRNTAAMGWDGSVAFALPPP